MVTSECTMPRHALAAFSMRYYRTTTGGMDGQPHSAHPPPRSRRPFLPAGAMSDTGHCAWTDAWPWSLIDGHANHRTSHHLSVIDQRLPPSVCPAMHNSDAHARPRHVTHYTLHTRQRTLDTLLSSPDLFMPAHQTELCRESHALLLGVNQDNQARRDLTPFCSA